MREIMFTKFSIRLQALVMGAFMGIVSLSSVAADSTPDELAQMRKKLEDSIQMMQALAARVRELEASQSHTAGQAPSVPDAKSASTVQGPQPAAVDATRLDAVEQKITEIETANATHRSDDTGLPMHGFADLGIGNHNPYNHDEKGTFLNNLDFYLTPRIGGKFLALFELNFEVDSTGTVGVDIERGQLGYQFSDAATLWVGRFHTPFGFVNTALHHGVWINDALRRPGFLMFEDQGGILPSHTVGAWLTGAERGDGGKILYDLFYGNGQQIIGGLIDMRSGGNDHGKPIYGGRLGYQWTAGPVEGLTVGLHAFEAHMDDDQIPEDSIDVRVFGGYAVYDTDRWEHMAEIYFFRNKDLTSEAGDHKSTAYYAQFGYRAPWAIPYIRYERASLDQTDVYFSSQLTGGSYYRSAGGFRYDFNTKTAFKFEIANTHYTDRKVGQFNEILGDIAIRF
jgi:hypothetical protein